MAIDFSSTGTVPLRNVPGRFRDEWSSRQRDGESHSAREGRP